MIVGPITVRSACSHHFCPVMGKIWIGVLPNERTNVIGLSKYARIAEWIMNRPQIQEEAVIQLADLIQDKTQPDGLAIVMEASHFCMAWRGVKDMDSKMINSVMRGCLPERPQPAPRIPLPHSPLGLAHAWYACSTPVAPSTPARRDRGHPGAVPPVQPVLRHHRHPCATAAASSCRRSKAAAWQVSDLYGHIQK
jgi:hypothetical protein